MSEPAKSGKNTTIIILLVALLLGVPCLLGVLGLARISHTAWNRAALCVIG